jgi:hypothetical protein
MGVLDKQDKNMKREASIVLDPAFKSKENLALTIRQSNVQKKQSKLQTKRKPEVKVAALIVVMRDIPNISSVGTKNEMLPIQLRGIAP